MKKAWPLDTAVSFDPYFGEPNRDGDQGYEIQPDGSVFLRLKAPGAKEVALDQFGNMHPLQKANDELWEGTVNLGRGFQYFFLKIDGNDVLSPYLPIGYGCCRPMNFLDIPVPGEEEWGALEHLTEHADDETLNELTRAAVQSTLPGIGRILEETERTEERFRANVNPELAIELLLLAVRQSTGKGK